MGQQLSEALVLSPIATTRTAGFGGGFTSYFSAPALLASIAGWGAPCGVGVSWTVEPEVRAQSRIVDWPERSGCRPIRSVTEEVAC
jgi:hypothetical protein